MLPIQPVSTHCIRRTPVKRTAGLRVELPVAGRPVLVVGGGPEAVGKIAALRDSGAMVTVVADEAIASIADLAERGLIGWHRRQFETRDLDDCWLVVAATGIPEADAHIAEQAALRSRFCLPGSDRAVEQEPTAQPQR